MEHLEERLFREFACDLPVIDWHNHLNAADLASARTYDDITALWIAPDPYKHRAMRICGVPERLVTGDASPYEKFCAWAETVPRLAGNPLYAWTKLELSRVFGVDEPLTGASAPGLWKTLNDRLDFTASDLLARFHVEYAAPCAAPDDDLAVFRGLHGVVPSLRGDSALAPDSFRFDTADAFRAHLLERLDAFGAAGCLFADHALDDAFRYVPDDGRNDSRYEMFRRNGTLSESDQAALECGILRFLVREYGRRGWTLQLHIGALRKTSARLRKAAGPAGGYAGIGHPCDTRSVAALLSDAETANALPRTILYTLNPADHAALAVLAGSFPGDGVRGNVTLGPAWWFCDHRHGIEDCLEAVCAYGMLSVFPGMTTDSRSYLSFVRHEYFRKVLCRFLARKAELEEFPRDLDRLGEIVRAVCYENAKQIITRR